jgi:hypothetical protein
MRRLAPIALLAITLTACGTGDRPASLGASASDSPAEIVTSNTDEPTPTEVALETTFAVGDEVDLGNWSVTVTDVQLNADKILMQPDFYNQKPKGQYVLATYKATYTGTERSADVIIDLSWSFTTTDNVIHEVAYQTTPGDENPDGTRTGGTLTKDVEFDLKPDLIKGGVLSVSTYDANFDEVYADFPIR